MQIACFDLIDKVKIALQWRSLRLSKIVRKKLEQHKILSPKPELKQEALFWEALREAGLEGSKGVDHISGRCYHNEKEYNVIFPLRYLAEVKRLEKSKTLDYVFVGKNEEGRAWINEFAGEKSYISLTDKGWKMPKEHFDSAYYQLLCNSRFALCPRGKFFWTYRFYEALMCKSIPIVDKNFEEPSMYGFKYYYYQEPTRHYFSLDIIEHNYKLFLKQHTLTHEFLDLTL